MADLIPDHGWKKWAQNRIGKATGSQHGVRKFIEACTRPGFVTFRNVGTGARLGAILAHVADDGSPTVIVRSDRHVVMQDGTLHFAIRYGSGFGWLLIDASWDEAVKIGEEPSVRFLAESEVRLP